MRSARECRGCRLPTHAPRPQRQARIGFRRPLKLDEQRRIVVPRQQPEQKPIGEPEDARIGRPTQLEQSSILINRSDFFPPHRLGCGRREEITSPQTGLFLLPDDGERFLVVQHRFTQLNHALEVARLFGHDFTKRPILNGETGGLI